MICVKAYLSSRQILPRRVVFVNLIMYRKLLNVIHSFILYSIIRNKIFCIRMQMVYKTGIHREYIIFVHFYGNSSWKWIIHKSETSFSYIWGFYTALTSVFPHNFYYVLLEKNFHCAEPKNDFLEGETKVINTFISNCSHCCFYRN